MDKELKQLRDGRWQKAFTGDGSTVHEDATVARNHKAIIVIEHLIQASDVAHTMQHWHIYRKWNERLFIEMSKAYDEGHSEIHVSTKRVACEVASCATVLTCFALTCNDSLLSSGVKASSASSTSTSFL